MRRGRPPHPELLTPREQEVHSLLREGLSNKQIAQRLGISVYGARYHVSEILSKLGVTSREEAACWQPEPSMRRSWIGALLTPFARVGELSGYKLVGGGVLAAAGVGLALLALGVFASSMREGPEPDATEPPAVAITPIPDGPVGPIVVMLPGNVPEKLQLYDAGRGAMLDEIDLPTERRISGSAEAGRIVVSDGSTILEVGLDGAKREVYRVSNDDHGIAVAALSPDGETIAFAEASGTIASGPSGSEPTEDIVFMNVDTGDETLRLSRSLSQDADDEFAGFIGSFYWLNWRDDGAGVIVSGATFSERPGSSATVFLDGRVVLHGEASYANHAPNATLAASGTVFPNCMAIAGEEILVHNLDSGALIAAARAEDGYIVTAWGWSPDSTELLVSHAPLIEMPPEEGWAADTLCPDFENQTWLLLDVATDTTRPVTDLSALYARWYAAEPLLTIDCAGTTVYLTPTRWAERYIQCWGVDSPVLHIDGIRVAEGNQFQVIGTIEVP